MSSPMSAKEFYIIYAKNSMELLGVEPSQSEMEERYKDYLCAVDYTDGADGELSFEEENGRLVVYFEPTPSQKADSLEPTS